MALTGAGNVEAANR